MTPPLEQYLYLRGTPAYVGALVRDPPMTRAQIIEWAGEEPIKRPTGDDAYSAVIQFYQGSIA